MDILTPIFTNVWALTLVVLFFGGSIFVHELGHFLAARRRGLKVERFSIGFGPKIVSWVRNGVEYRLSWLPLGGYVALPQLADMRGIEGEPSTDAEALPPISYTDKMIVSVMGAVFNLIFAFALACVVMVIGQWTDTVQATTRVGYVVPTVTLPDGTEVPSPAAEAGLQIGDTVRTVDGRTVDEWDELRHALITGTQHSKDGRRQTTLGIIRDGAPATVVVHPRLLGDDQMRQIGIGPYYESIVGLVEEGSLAEEIGLRQADFILSIGGVPVTNVQVMLDVLTQRKAEALPLVVRRDTEPIATVTLTIPARPDEERPENMGFYPSPQASLVYPNPFKQFYSHVAMTIRTLGSLLHPGSDIGLSDLSGPVGIMRLYYQAASADIRFVLWFTILVNINLAIFNLLPIPVLDGGHMLFATIGKVRGRALPPNFLVTTQSVFMILLLTMVLYVTVFDVRRWKRDSDAEGAALEQQAEPADAPHSTDGEQPAP